MDDELDVAKLDVIIRAEDILPRFESFLKSLPASYGPGREVRTDEWRDEKQEQRASIIALIRTRLTEKDAVAELDGLRDHQDAWCSNCSWCQICA